MDRVTKFLRHLDAKLRQRLEDVLACIVCGDLEGLDMKKLEGHKNLYRCRIGDIRIVCAKIEDGSFVILDVHFRGQIYKKHR